MNHSSYLAHPVRVRFAPSPTGYMHIGALRTILCNILMAQSSGGVWLLRLEDTDKKRQNTEAFQEFMNSLELFGIAPDEGVTYVKTDYFNDEYKVYQTGDFSPYIQSERLSLYQACAQNMLDKKLAYWSHLSPDERERIQRTKQLTKKPINWKKESEKYQEKMYLSVKEVLDNPEIYPYACLRYQVQRDECIHIDDILVGTIECNLALEEDPVFLKRDGYPTYHLAHLVDDFDMNIDIAVRTQEWVASVGIHRQSYIDLYGKEQVKLRYLHAPFILGETGNKKMSKRDGNVNIQSYLDEGFLPEAIINYLAFLGWNPGTDKEIYWDGVL